MKSVLLLGAGASAASRFALPTMAGFFDPIEGVDGTLREFLSWFYPGRAPNDYNLEEVLAFLDISRARLPLWGVAPTVPHRFPKGELYSELIRFVKQRLAIPETQSCDLHTALCRTLTADDSIISLNYDVVMERSLGLLEDELNSTKRDYGETRLGKVPGLIGTVIRFMQPTPSLINREQEGGFYLKLHGSLDWLFCPTAGCYNNANLYSTEVSGHEGQTEGAPCRYCGSALQVYIIPPVATKRLEDRGRMAFIWNLALREVMAAEEVVIVGLSFAASDFELRWLLRQALLLRNAPLPVSVVNRNADHAEAIFRFLPQDALRGRVFPSLEEFVESRQAVA